MPSNNSDYPKLLRQFFKLSGDAKLELQSFLRLDLKPTKNFAGDCYPIEDDLVLGEPNFAGSMHWTLGQSIVPIVELSTDRRSVRCLGTGFYIHTNGLMLTAAHVLQDFFDRAKEAPYDLDIERIIKEEGPSRLGVMLKYNQLFGDNAFEFLPIRWAHVFAGPDSEVYPWRKIKPKFVVDVAVCQTFGSQSGKLFQPLPIIQPGIKGFGTFVGRQVFAIGYGQMQDFTTIEGTDSGEMNFVPYLTRGNVTNRLPNNHIDKQVLSPGPCFQLAAKVPSGMSGSPVFDAEGIYVHGLASTGWQGVNGTLESDSCCSMIAPICELPLGALGGKSIYDMLADQNGGMVKIFAPGDM